MNSGLLGYEKLGNLFSGQQQQQLLNNSSNASTVLYLSPFTGYANYDMAQDRQTTALEWLDRRINEIRVTL